MAPFFMMKGTNGVPYDPFSISVCGSPSSVGGAHRQAAVLARAAQKVGWDRPMPKDVGLGIATTFGQERAIRPGWPGSLACASRS